jgi:hypothetical protein
VARAEYDKGQFRVIHFSTLDGLSGELTTAVKAARDGSVWVGTFGNGLNRIQGDRVSRYSTADGLPGNTVTAIEEDEAGRLWVACGESVASFQTVRFISLPSAAKQPIYALSADPRGVCRRRRSLATFGQAADPSAGQPGTSSASSHASRPALARIARVM